MTAAVAAVLLLASGATGGAQIGPLIGRVQAVRAARAAASTLQITRISVASDGTQANGSSYDPAITADGRYAAFTSYASNLAPGAAADKPNIFLRDTQTNQTSLLVTASHLLGITPDGRYVSYRASFRDSDDLTTLYVLDRQTGTTTTLPTTNSISDDFRYYAKAVGEFWPYTASVVDRVTGASVTVGDGGNPILSGDGRLVIYWRYTTSFASAPWVTDLSTGRTEQLATVTQIPKSIRANRFMLFSQGVSSDSPTVVFDYVSRQVVVSSSRGASVSANGRYVAYAPSTARSDVYLYDQLTNTTVRVSAPPTGAAANGDSTTSAVDDNGRVAFASRATNLVTGDTNNASDIFLGVGGIDANVPTEPRSLLAIVTVSAGSASVDLSWLAPGTGGTPEGYTIEAGSTSGASDLASFFNGAATALRATVPLRRTIFVRVRAVTRAGESPPSNEVSFTPGGGVPPGPPFALSVAGRHGSSAELIWVAPFTGDRPVTYIIHVGSSGGASDLGVFATGSSDTTIRIGGTDGRTTYARVLAMNSSGASPPSNEVAFFSPGCGTLVPPQGPPTALTASVSGSRVTLQFGAVQLFPSGIPSYVVQAGSTAGDSDVATYDGGTSIPMVINDVPPGIYFMRVRARNSCGSGPASNEVTVTVR